MSKKTFNVRERGYWFINEETNDLEYSSWFPVFVTGDWIFVEGPGTIEVENNKIKGFVREAAFSSPTCPPHKMIEYVGFTDCFYYCEKCNFKDKEK
jgi:hypothetical protein